MHVVAAGVKVAGRVGGSGGKFMIFNNCNFTRNCELQVPAYFASENAKTNLAFLKGKLSREILPNLPNEVDHQILPIFE